MIFTIKISYKEGFIGTNMDREELDQLLQVTPGGIAKMALDDMLTILYATDTFFSLIRSITDKSIEKVPVPLLRMVYSADIIYVTQQMASQKGRKDNMININFRTLQSNGSFKWVMLTGKKTAETYQNGTKTVPVYSCIAMDITLLMVQYKKLEQQNDYNRVTTELSKDLYFEYEIATDTLSFSEIFREIFGKESVIKGFSKRLENSKLIHQEELPAVVSIYQSLMKGRKQVRFEVRLIPKDGKPMWYVCYASVIIDENRTPYKVVGKFSQTNPPITEIQEKPVYRPQLDRVTNLCNKESVEYMIEEAAQNPGDSGLSALFILEVRNFKGMNEVRKTIGKKDIMSEVADVLRDEFRSTDILGRIGLDQLVIYMKNVNSDKEVYKKADGLCKRIEESYGYSYTATGVSVSVGIVLQRGARSYQTLFINASNALAVAKKTPTSSFEVFGITVN